MIACQSTTTREIAEAVGRPQDLKAQCISNGDGTCYRDGQLVQTTNMFCGEATEWSKIQKHLENMEKFKYNCTKFGECE